MTAARSRLSIGPEQDVEVILGKGVRCSDRPDRKLRDVLDELELENVGASENLFDDAFSMLVIEAKAMVIDKSSARTN